MKPCYPLPPHPNPFPFGPPPIPPSPSPIPTCQYSKMILLNRLSTDSKSRILRGAMLFVLLMGLLCLFLLTPTPAPPRHSAYQQYLHQYGSKYSGEQARYRQFLFYYTYDEVVSSNKQLDGRYSSGLNKFAELKQDEWQQLYLSVIALAKMNNYLEIAEFEDNYFYDWSPFLPAPKNMRDFDASHIFAATAAVEFAANKQTVLQMRARNQTREPDSPWLTLAEQEIIDCCDNCLAKKSPKTVYAHLGTYGITSDAKYPYRNSIYQRDIGECKTENDRKHYFVKSYTDITNCRDLAEQLKFSPVVVYVDARAWRDYDGGIMESCGTRRNHYALVVGRGIGYWKIRNSWGENWGENGHIRIKSGNTCGICGKGTAIDLH